MQEFKKYFITFKNIKIHNFRLYLFDSSGKLLFFVTLMTNLSLIPDISYRLCQTQSSEDPERPF